MTARILAERQFDGEKEDEALEALEKEQEDKVTSANMGQREFVGALVRMAWASCKSPKGAAASGEPPLQGRNGVLGVGARLSVLLTHCILPVWSHAVAC